MSEESVVPVNARMAEALAALLGTICDNTDDPGYGRNAGPLDVLYERLTMAGFTGSSYVVDVAVRYDEVADVEDELASTTSDGHPYSITVETRETTALRE